MAEYILKDMVAKRGIANQFFIASAATSAEEIGNPVHCGTERKLAEHGISVAGKRAVQLKREDYEKYDYLVGMESANIRNILRIVGEDREHKVYRLLDFGYNRRDIADPWYTGDFDTTYEDICEGCEAFLKFLNY
jgi:protein-tyrosine phosphatase